LDEKKATMKPEEKSQIMTLIKSLTISIEKAKEDLLKLVQTTSKRRSVSDVSVFLAVSQFGQKCLLLTTST
jgi:hypothetical protein